MSLNKLYMYSKNQIKMINITTEDYEETLIAFSLQKADSSSLISVTESILVPDLLLI